MITRCQPPVNSQVPAEAIQGEASLKLLCFGLVCAGSGLEGPRAAGCLFFHRLPEHRRHWMRTRDGSPPSLPSFLLPNTAGWAAASQHKHCFHLIQIKHISDHWAQSSAFMVLPGLGALVGRLAALWCYTVHIIPTSVLFDNTAESRYRGISVIIFVFVRLTAWRHETIFFNQQFCGLVLI